MLYNLYLLFILYVEVFPELCTINLNDIPTETLLKRNITQKQENQQVQQAQLQGQQHPITRTVTQGKRWLFVLVVFVYLILSKLIARSSGTTN